MHNCVQVALILVSSAMLGGYSRVAIAQTTLPTPLPVETSAPTLPPMQATATAPLPVLAPGMLGGTNPDAPVLPNPNLIPKTAPVATDPNITLPETPQAAVQTAVKPPQASQAITPSAPIQVPVQVPVIEAIPLPQPTAAASLPPTTPSTGSLPLAVGKTYWPESSLLLSRLLETNEASSAVQQLLTTNACRGCNLRGANLQNAMLMNADLSGADLSGANLREADLRNAKLGNAVLSGTNLSGTIMPNGELHQ